MKRLFGSVAKAFSFLVASLPESVRVRIGRGIGWLWFDVFKIRRRVALENLLIAFPELTDAERVRLARSSLQHMGQTLIEFTLFPFFDRRKVEERFVFEGLEHVRKALAQGHGMIMLTCHLGNGDFATAALSRIGFPMNLISKEFKTAWLNDLWFGMRSRHGTKFISPEKSSFEILRALKRNEIVIFVLDQFMGPPVGVRTTFFGKETGTAMGCAVIAERTKAPVIPAYTYRREDGKHVVVIEPPIELPPNDQASGTLDHRPSDKNIAVLTQAYTDKIEQFVRLHPEQWMWIHRRWKEFRE